MVSLFIQDQTNRWQTTWQNQTVYQSTKQLESDSGGFFYLKISYQNTQMDCFLFEKRPSFNYRKSNKQLIWVFWYRILRWKKATVRLQSTQANKEIIGHSTTTTTRPRPPTNQPTRPNQPTNPNQPNQPTRINPTNQPESTQKRRWTKTHTEREYVCVWVCVCVWQMNR